MAIDNVQDSDRGDPMTQCQVSLIAVGCRCGSNYVGSKALRSEGHIFLRRTSACWSMPHEKLVFVCTVQRGTRPSNVTERWPSGLMLSPVQLCANIDFHIWGQRLSSIPDICIQIRVSIVMPGRAR